ncbi:hypothetical protein N8T08_002224 [Aspergillus melleus]|uniref:Uncharacterized protein n=1 Tax=Aspergillus melleus TaxID=138277 RepID=A0ACC3B927_9EURO|nr:hypothetical protein N8T08_002224 [Aspergillus melleus]
MESPESYSMDPPSVILEDRIDTWFFFEVKEVLGDEDIDWQFLALRLEEEAGPVQLSLYNPLKNLVRDYERLLNEDQSGSSAIGKVHRCMIWVF